MPTFRISEFTARRLAHTGFAGSTTRFDHWIEITLTKGQAQVLAAFDPDPERAIHLVLNQAEQEACHG